MPVLISPNKIYRITLHWGIRMSRRDILKILKDSTAYSKLPILEENNCCDVADRFKQNITEITGELQKQRKMSAPIKAPSFFDRLHCEKTHLTRVERSHQRKKDRSDALHNFMFGYAPIGRKSTGNSSLPLIETRQRAASVPLQEEEHTLTH